MSHHTTNGQSVSREDRESFDAFVARSRWQFAKTYVEDYPHGYTLQRWGEPDEFQHAIASIERWGVVESFWGSQRKYLYFDEFLV